MGEQRSTPRIPLSVPLKLRWAANDGNVKEEQTFTEVLNASGARFWLQGTVQLGMEVEVTNLHNKETARARVAWAGEPEAGHGQRVAIQFLTVKAAFWGSESS
jgi:hypothetical protein